MGRYIDRAGGNVPPSPTPFMAPDGLGYNPPTQGRYTERMLGLGGGVTIKGRYRSFKEDEEEFLNSEEGQRLVQEILEQQQKIYEQTQEEVTQMADRTASRLEVAQSATRTERTMFGEQGTRRVGEIGQSLVDELKDLGWTQQEIDDQFKGVDLGIDVDAVQRYREERLAVDDMNRDFAREFGMSESTNAVGYDSPTLRERFLTSANWLTETFTKENFSKAFVERREIEAPFRSKRPEAIENRNDVLELSTFGGATAQFFFNDIVNPIAEGITATAQMLAFEYYLQQKALFQGKDISEVSAKPFYDISRFGWTPANLGQEAYDENIVLPLTVRAVESYMDLDKENPNRHVRNSAIVVWEQVGKPALDAWIASDIARGFGSALTTKVVSRETGRNVVKQVKPNVFDVSPEVMKFRAQTETVQLQTAYQVLGFSRSDIAALSNMSMDEASLLLAQRMRERATAILRDDFVPAPGSTLTREQLEMAVQPSSKEVLDFLNALKREGSLTPAQEIEILRLNLAVAQVVRISDDAVIGIPRLIQVANEFGILTSQPIRSLAEAEYAVQRALRLRARAAGEAPIRPNIGMTIEDVSSAGGRSKKFVDEDTAGRINPIVKKAKEDPAYVGIEFAFDSRTNTLLITPESAAAWSALSPSSRTAIEALARENRVNLGQAWGWEEGVVPGVDEFDGIVQGFSRADVEIQKKINEYRAEKAAQMKEVEIFDTKFLSDGLPADDPMIEMMRQWGVNQDMLVKALSDVPQDATNRTVPNIISQQLLNTPLDAAATIPAISRSGLDTTNPVGQAIVNNAGDGFIARMADIARRLPTPQAFAQQYGFLADARYVPPRAERGDGLFREVSNPAARLRDFLDDNLVREQIGKLIRAQIPLDLVKMTPAWRTELLEDATQGISAKALEKFIDPYGEGELIRDQIYQRSEALTLLTDGLIQNKALARDFLLNYYDNKPNVPMFALTDEGQAVLLSQNRETQRTIAAAKYAGFDTIPGYIVDMKGAREDFKKFLKDNNLDLASFAKESRRLTPALKAKAVSQDLSAKELRTQAGIISGDLKLIGTSAENMTVVPSKFLRRDLPVDQPIIYNGLLARELWDIQKMTVLGEGYSRKVFEVGPDAILKVAKNELGLVQNLMVYNTHALQQGLIPRLFSGGDNWILTERHEPLSGEALALFQEFQDYWRYFQVRQQAEATAEAQAFLQALEKKAGIIDTMDFLELQDSLPMVLYRKKLFEFLNEWRQTPAAQMAATKDGKPFYNWDEFARYDINLDVIKEDSWGVRPDGTMVLVDEGALYQEALNVTRGPQKTWRDFFKNFDDTVKKSAEIKKKFQDYDPHINFAFVPIPMIDGDDENGYQDDILRSVLMSAIAGTLSRGKGGKLPKKRKRTELDDLRKQQLPASPAANPAVIKGALNADVFRARTGEPFGGVFPVPRGVPFGGVGVSALDGTKNLAPLGDAQYTITSRDAAEFLGKGAIDNIISHVDNPVVIRNNKDLQELAKKAGIINGIAPSVYERVLEKNIKLLRDYLEGRGHDGVIISMNSKLGQIDEVEAMFKHNQLINFSNKWQLATSPNTPKVPVVKQTRTKKLQRQIMRAIDPPKNMIEMEEARLLRLRLRTLNAAIKEGRKLGAAESRKFITARLRNSFSIYTNKMTRKHELQRLRDSILRQEKQLIKQELVNYAKIKLPTKESREFLAERGKLIDSIAKLNTRAQLYKKMKQIDDMAEKVERRVITKEIEKVMDRATNSPSVSADYRKLIKQFMSQYNLTGQRPATRERINKMKAYIDRQRALGEDIEITEGMLKQMEILSRTNLADLPVATLKNVLDDLIILERIGRNKLRAENALFEAQKAQRMEEILKDISPIEETLKPLADKPWLKLTPKQKLQDAMARFHDFRVRTGLAIYPADTMIELLSTTKGAYESGVYRYLKAIHDENFGEYLQEAFLLRNKYQALMTETKLTEENMVRIGIAMTKDQGEDAVNRMIAMGMTADDINGIVLTDAENRMRLFFRETLDAERPMLAKLARTIYNVEFNEVDNFFPMLADFQRSKDLSLHERFGKAMPLYDVDKQVLARGKRTKVKADTLKKRVKGAINPIRLNAADVFFNHMDNSLYMKHMARDVKMVSEIVNSEEYAVAAGKIGQEFSKDYLDLLARKGGADGQQAIEWIDFLNRNSGVAILGFKLSTILIQASAFAQGAALTGASYMSRATVDIITRPDIRKFIHNNFPEIRETYGNDLGFLDKPFMTDLEKVQNLGYSGIIIVDRMARTSTGWAAYVKRMEELGLDPYDFTRINKEAADYSQRITRLTNASSLWKDAPIAISRGKMVFGNRSMNRAFLKFMTFPLGQFSLVYNNAIKWGYGEFIKTGDWNKFKMANYIMLMIMIAKTFEVAVRIEASRAEQSLAGKTPEVDTFWQGMLKEMSMTIPFASPAVSVGMYGSTAFPAGSGIVSTLRGGFRLGGDLFGESTMKPSSRAKAAVDIGTGIGTIIGIPGMVQMRALLRNLIDAEEEGSSSGGQREGGGVF